jgi:dihydrofolate synthase/folylpolyglutamate synthase
MTEFQDFMARLDGLGVFHMDLSLGRMAAFAQRAGKLPFRVLHVVGTNGKGSTATLLAELCAAHGLRTGLYTSPHFVSVRERVLVDGAMLPEGDWARLGRRAEELARGLGLTYFELLTAVAVLAFAEAGCDVAVMEAGLGGRFDATNVLSPELTVFTPIGMDHMNILGDTLAKIAADKAGAMRPGGVAVSAPQEPDAWRELCRASDALGTRLIPASEVLSYTRGDGRLRPGPAGARVARAMDGLVLALRGPHQEDNARTALAAFHVWTASLRLPVYPEACRTALARAFIPGRMQFTQAGRGLPPLILDGGHNAHGLAALARALDACDVRPEALVFGCLRDKPLDTMLPIARGLTRGRVLACGIPGCARACAPDELAAMLGPDVQAYADVHAALAELEGCAGPVLVCGSLYLLGEFYTRHAWLLERGPHSEAGAPAAGRC